MNLNLVFANTAHPKQYDNSSTALLTAVKSIEISTTYTKCTNCDI